MMESCVVTTKTGVTEYLFSNRSTTPVVLLSGVGGSLYEWKEIITTSELSVLAYNRAGYGRSKSVKREGTVEEASHELHALLSELGITQKILLAGHSYGGLIAQDFAIRYPGAVLGVLLIDSTSINIERIDEVEHSDETTSDVYWIHKCEAYARMKREDLMNEIQPELPEKFKLWEREVQTALIDHETSPSMYRAVGAEIRHMPQSAKRLNTADFPDIPLTVIGRDGKFAADQQINAGLPKSEAIAFEEVWTELIHEQTSLSSRSVYIKAEGAGHNIPYDCPELIIKEMTRLHSRI